MFSWLVKPLTLTPHSYPMKYYKQVIVDFDSQLPPGYLDGTTLDDAIEGKRIGFYGLIEDGDEIIDGIIDMRNTFGNRD